MNAISIDETVTDIINSFKETDSKNFQRLLKALEKYEELEKKGLITKKGPTVSHAGEKFKLTTNFPNTTKFPFK